MANTEEVGVEAVVEGFGRFIFQLGSMDKAISQTGLAGVSSAAGLGRFNLALGAIALGATAVIAGVGLIVTAITKIATTSVQTAISVEDAFANILKTTTGLGTNLFDLTEQGEEVFQAFRDLAQEVPLTFEELADIGGLAGQLGIAEDQLADFTATIAALGVSTNLTVEEATLGLARIGQVFGVETDNMADNTERLASGIVFLGNNFRVTEQEILLFARNIAGVAAVTSSTQADVLGIAAAFSETGIRAEAGGTAVQNAFIKIIGAVAAGGGTVEEEWVQALHNIVAQSGESFGDIVDIASEGGEEFESFATSLGVSTDHVLSALTRGIGEEGSDILQTFADTAGVTSEEFVQLWEEDSTEAFVRFIEGLDAAGKDASLILDELGLASSRSARTFLAMGQSSDRLREIIGASSDAFNENTALVREAEIRYGTFQSQIIILKNSLRDMALTIGLQLLPILGGLFEEIRPVVDAMADALGPAMQNITDAIETSLLPALGNLLEAFGLSTPEDFAQLITDIGESAANSIESFSEFVNEVARFVDIFREGGFAGVLEELGIDEATAETIDLFTISIGEAALEVGAFALAVGAIGLVIGGITNPIGLLIIALGTLKALWKTFGEQVTVTVGQLGAIVAFWALQVGSWFSTLIIDASRAADELILTIRLMFFGALLAASEWATNFLETFREGFFTAIDAIVGFVQVMVTTISEEGVAGWVRVGTAFIAGLWQGIQQFWNTVLMPGLERLVRNALGLINTITETDSPSRVFADIGKNWVEGLAMGINDNAFQPEAALINVADQSIAAAAQNAPTNNNSSSIDQSRVTTVNANYFETQSPSSIVTDLALAEALG